MRGGFSLLEVMAAVGLMVILGSFGVSTLRTSNRRQMWQAAIDKTRSILQTARSNALAGRKDCNACGAVAGAGCGSTGDTPLAGWRVTIDAVAKTYVLEGRCGAGGNTPFLSSGVTALIPSNLNISVVQPSVLFRPNNGTTDLGGTMTVTISDVYGNWGQVIVNTNGSIN